MSSRGKPFDRSDEAPETSCIVSDPIRYLMEKYRDYREARRARRHTKQKPPCQIRNQPASVVVEKHSLNLRNRNSELRASDDRQDVSTPELEKQRDDVGALTPAVQRSRVLAPESPARGHAPLVPEDKRHAELRRILKESLARENLPGKKKRAKWQSRRIARPQCEAGIAVRNGTILGRMKRCFGKGCESIVRVGS